MTLKEPQWVDEPRVDPPARRDRPAAIVRQRLTSPWASLAAVIIATLWTLPTVGLLITSFRPQPSIQNSGWWNVFGTPEFTLDNYGQVLGGSTDLTQYVVNSLVITIPAVVLPVLLASLAAYAFAWMQFPGRDTLFVAVFALQVVPVQVTLIPLLSLYVDQLRLNGTFWSVWLSHTIFALPLAIFLLHNFMRQIPMELIEAARMDGAGHDRIFRTILLPLLTPALAAFGIFQFLWVWNDLLVSLTFVGGTPKVAPITVRVAELAGSRGSAWYLLSAGAFVSMIIPVIVFLAFQRYFVRGLLAGGLKG